MAKFWYRFNYYLYTVDILVYFCLLKLFGVLEVILNPGSGRKLPKKMASGCGLVERYATKRICDAVYTRIYCEEKLNFSKEVIEEAKMKAKILDDFYCKCTECGRKYYGWK